MDGRLHRWLVIIALACLLASCATGRLHPNGSGRATPPAESGPIFAAHLQSRYDDATHDCRGTPAVLCTARSTFTYNAWPIRSSPTDERRASGPGARF